MRFKLRRSKNEINVMASGGHRFRMLRPHKWEHRLKVEDGRLKLVILAPHFLAELTVDEATRLELIDALGNRGTKSPKHKLWEAMRRALAEPLPGPQVDPALLAASGVKLS